MRERPDRALERSAQRSPTISNIAPTPPCKQEKDDDSPAEWRSADGDSGRASGTGDDRQLRSERARSRESGAGHVRELGGLWLDERRIEPRGVVSCGLEVRGTVGQLHSPSPWPAEFRTIPAPAPPPSLSSCHRPASPDRDRPQSPDQSKGKTRSVSVNNHISTADRTKDTRRGRAEERETKEDKTKATVRQRPSTCYYQTALGCIRHGRVLDEG